MSRVLLSSERGEPRAEQYKGGTDFCNTWTLLPKDQLGVASEIVCLPRHSAPEEALRALVFGSLTRFRV